MLSVNYITMEIYSSIEKNFWLKIDKDFGYLD